MDTYWQGPPVCILCSQTLLMGVFQYSQSYVSIFIERRLIHWQIYFMYHSDQDSTNLGYFGCYYRIVQALYYIGDFHLTFTRVMEGTWDCPEAIQLSNISSNLWKKVRRNRHHPLKCCGNYQPLEIKIEIPVNGNFGSLSHVWLSRFQ